MPKIIKTRFNKKKSSLYSINPVFGYVLCGLKGFVLCILLLLIVSLVLYKSNDFGTFYKIIIYLVIFLSSFFTGTSSYKYNTGKGLIIGLKGSVPFVLFLFLLCVVLLKFKVSAFLLIVVPLSVCGSAIGGIIEANKIG